MAEKYVAKTSDRWTGIHGAYKKQMIQEGNGLHKPNEGASCIVHISLVFSDLPEAESIVGYPINIDSQICLGTGIGDMSPAFDSCMESMRAGERCKIFIAKKNDVNCLSEDDFGLEWRFVIHLISFTQSKDIWVMTEEEKFTKSTIYKDLGTKCFKEAKTHQAECFYLRAMKYVIAIGKWEETKNPNQYSTLKLLLSLNIAACQLKHKHYQSVIVHCTNALNVDEGSAKAMFRRGQAFMELQEFELAKSDFKHFLKLEPNNRAVQCQMKLLVEKMKKLDAQYAVALSKMFGGSASKGKN